MEEKIVYFEKGGKENTAEVLRLVRERAIARGIRKVVVASTRGDTAKAAMAAFNGTNIKMAVIPWQFGFVEVQPFPQELVAELEKKGHKVHFSTILFHQEDFYINSAPKLIATVLRTIGQGVKVGVETTLMACNGGLVDKGEKVICIAGTGAGADTAMVVTASPSTKLSDFHVHEIICKPL